jgi:hypothetical protein
MNWKQSFNIYKGGTLKVSKLLEPQKHWIGAASDDLHGYERFICFVPP